MFFLVDWTEKSDEWKIGLDKPVNGAIYPLNWTCMLLVHKEKPSCVSLIVKVHFFPHNVHHFALPDQYGDVLHLKCQIVRLHFVETKGELHSGTACTPFYGNSQRIVFRDLLVLHDVSDLNSSFFGYVNGLFGHGVNET